MEQELKQKNDLIETEERPNIPKGGGGVECQLAHGGATCLGYRKLCEKHPSQTCARYCGPGLDALLALMPLSCVGGLPWGPGPGYVRL